MREQIRVAGRVACDPRLLRLVSAFFGFTMGEVGTWVAILVYAYDRGGASAAGAVAAVQLIPAGTEVTRDGAHVTDRLAGDHVGEVALLRDMPTTATLTAKTPMILLTLEREAFLEAVTGHPQSHARAKAIVEDRLPPAKH